MNIIESIVKLRDDIKLWVTNNLQFLDEKIESKTFPIDNALSNTSTNPVQNKVIATELIDLNNKVGKDTVAN